MPCATPSCPAAPDWCLGRGWAASYVRHRRATSPRPVRGEWGIGCRKCGNGEAARSSSVNVASTRSTESDQPVKLDRSMSIGRSGLTKSGDHRKSNHHCTSLPPAGHRPTFPCSPMTCSATSLSAMLRKSDQSLPAAPAGRLCRWRTGEFANLRVQTVRTDQQIPFCRAAVLELDPHPVTRADRPDHAGTASDAVHRKALQQTAKQDSTWDHPDRSAKPVHDRGQVDVDQRTAGRRRHPHGGQQLARPVHIDAKLLENRRAVGPDGHRAATGPRIRSLFEDGDVVAISQQSPCGGNAADPGADDQDPKRARSRSHPRPIQLWKRPSGS